MPSRQSRSNRFLIWGFVALLLNASYLASYAHPTLFYFGNVLLHVALGLALLLAAIPLLPPA